MNRPGISAKFDGFLRIQGLCGAIILASWLIFWAVENPVRNLPDLFIYVLTQINLTVVLLYPLKFLYEDQRVRYHWPVHVISIFVVNGIVVITSAFVIHGVDRLNFPFLDFLHHSWKFPFVANLVFAFAYEGHKVATRRLRRRNQQLQCKIEFETAERELEAEELRQARDIQRGLLPKEIPELEGFQITGAWEPAKLVGGDYYDVIPVAKNKVALCIADVAGKGVSAALLMANVQAAIRAFASESVPPSRVCAQTNSVLCINTAVDKFVTLFYGILDAVTRTLTYVNAGHPRPVIIRSNGDVIHLEAGEALLGVFRDWTYRDSILQLEPGDLLLLFTDGITEAMRQDGQEFGEDRMIAEILNSGEHSLGQIQAHLFSQMKAFCDARLSDDATLVMVAASPLVQDKEPSALGHKSTTQRHLEYAGAQS